MSFLATVTNKPPQYGQRIVIAGVEKSGKTTLATQAPNSLLIPLEKGFAGIQTNRVGKDILHINDVWALCDELKQFAIQGRLQRGVSLVWDSATVLERLIHTDVIESSPEFKSTQNKKNAAQVTMEAALGGYGKAYNRANELFEDFLRRMDELAFNAGINIILTCHVFPSKIIDPNAGEYYNWDLLLHSPKNDKNYGKREIITQWADMIGYLYEPLIFMKAGEGEKMNRALSAGKGRVLGVSRTPSYVAGNRYNLTNEIQIPLNNGWNYLADAIYKSKGIDIFNRNLA